MLLIFTFTLVLVLLRHVLASTKLSYGSLVLVKRAQGLTKIFISATSWRATSLPVSNKLDLVLLKLSELKCNIQPVTLLKLESSSVTISSVQIGSSRAWGI